MPATTVTARTSQSHPLQISTIESPGGGRIGLTFCPGKKDPHAMTGAWDRDLAIDLEVIREWGARVLVTLMEENELELLSVPTLGEAASVAGLFWVHLPIQDVSVPSETFEHHWPAAFARIERELATGNNVVIHCRGGLGRTGLVAGMVLIGQGVKPIEALEVVRQARPGAVETAEQERFLLDFIG